MSNDIVIEAWNTVLFEKFSRFKYLFVEGYAAISDEVLGRHRIAEGARVLDVGCGFGDCTIKIAGFVGENGLATGVDCASNFIAECKRTAASAGIGNIQFLVADVEVDDLQQPVRRGVLRPLDAPCFSICPVQR